MQLPVITNRTSTGGFIHARKAARLASCYQMYANTHSTLGTITVSGTLHLQREEWTSVA